MSKAKGQRQLRPWQQRMSHIIFGTDSFEGRAFDIALLCAILLSIISMMLETVDYIKRDYGGVLTAIEWGFTILFSLEYIARIVSVTNPWKYIFSFYGIVDLLSILPTYMGIFFTGNGSEYLRVVRSVRLIRVFRVLKLVRFMGEGTVLLDALKASRAKIIVFLGVVVIFAVISGTIMYIAEGIYGPPEAKADFTSIPRSIYWALVTMTTVGYGDIVPHTEIGQFLASVLMIMAYGVIAVPTGIVSAEMTRTRVDENSDNMQNDQVCPHCGETDHLVGAKYCHHCSGKL